MGICIPYQIRSQGTRTSFQQYGGFLKRGYPNSWMVYNGESYYNGWFEGITILGNFHII